MNLQVEDQFLRMSDLANQAAKPETTKIDKTGCKLTHKAIPAKRGITVHHRIGGLEEPYRIRFYSHGVHHRIGGLEEILK